MSTSKEPSSGASAFRAILGEMKLPKEAISAAFAQADKTKREMVQAIMSEVKQALDGMELEVHATIRLKPAASKKSTVRAKKGK